jgi:hypothetical protein
MFDAYSAYKANPSIAEYVPEFEDPLLMAMRNAVIKLCSKPYTVSGMILALVGKYPAEMISSRIDDLTKMMMV